ncbi:hypothetical protein Bca4012_025066 [Brassica carinata]
MRIAFSRLIRRAAADQRLRHSGADHGNRHGKKGPFSTRDKPMPEEPKKTPPVLSKREKRIGVLRLEKARLVDGRKHIMKGYEKLVALLAHSLCDVKRGILYDRIVAVEEKDEDYRKELTKVESELASLGEEIGGVGDVSGDGGDVTGGGGGVDGTGVGGDGGGEGTGGGDVGGDGEVGGGGN